MNAPFPKAADCGLARCETCGKLSTATLGYCPACNSALHLRKPGSVQKTLALIVAALALYIPSHLLPIMTVVQLGQVTRCTIIQGMLEFWKSEDYPIALVIFTASILIPLLKIVALSWLCAAASGKVHPSTSALGRVYWLTELLGRWSMVDIFVLGILVSLVQLGNYASISPEPGALAFAGVVMFTMLAAMSFDFRLLWDRLDELPAKPDSSSPPS